MKRYDSANPREGDFHNYCHHHLEKIGYIVLWKHNINVNGDPTPGYGVQFFFSLVYGGPAIKRL